MRSPENIQFIAFKFFLFTKPFTYLIILGSNFWPTVLGKSANDGFCGFGGLVSALIACYETF
jgi:hypothetical protein